MAKARATKKTVEPEQAQQELALPETELAVSEKPKEGVLFQGVTEGMLAEFEQWAEWKVTDVKDKTQIKLLSERLRKLQKARTGVDEIRKDKNDEYQKIIRENNAAAKAVTDRIVAVEDKMKSERERVEKIQEEERIRLEQEKFEARKKRLNAEGAVMLEGAIRTLSDEAFEQSFALAVAQAEQQRLLDKQREEQEKERLRLEQERLERERLQREEEERLRAEQEAERKRRQQEEDDRRAEEARPRAEAQRLEDERLAAARKKLEDEAAEFRRQQEEANRERERQFHEQERIQREAQERIDAENRRLEEERLAMESRKRAEADAAYDRFQADFDANGEDVIENWRTLYPEISSRIDTHVEAARERRAREEAAEAERVAKEEQDRAAAEADRAQREMQLGEPFEQEVVDSVEWGPSGLTSYQESVIDNLKKHEGTVIFSPPVGTGKGVVRELLVDRVEVVSCEGRLVNYDAVIASAAKEYVAAMAACESTVVTAAAYRKLSWMIVAEERGLDPATYSPDSQ